MALLIIDSSNRAFAQGVAGGNAYLGRVTPENLKTLKARAAEMSPHDIARSYHQQREAEGASFVERGHRTMEQYMFQIGY